MTQVECIAEARAPARLSPSDHRDRAVMRIAYLCTEYPKVSHTFIRREILELERRGHEIVRVAIRGNKGAVADPLDREESHRTFVCLSRPKFEFAAALGWAVIARPLGLFKAARIAIAMSRVSERGLIRHLAYLAEALLLTRMLIQQRVSHVHVHFGTNSAAVARLARVLGGPTYSMTVHGPDEFDAPRGFSLAAKVADAEFVVAISDYCSAQIRRWATLGDWHKIHVVHCTVGDEYFDDREPIHPQSNQLVCVGRLSAQKGHLLLLEAAAELVKEGCDFRLVLAGDGEMRQEIEARIAALSLRKHVEITGWIDEAQVRRHILNSRALVQASFAEGLPVVLMEAMALQRPVIASAIAGVPELVQQGISGWLIPAGNANALGEAMRAALRAPAAHLNAMGAEGCHRVRNQHRTRNEVDKLEALLASSIQTAGGC